jgi:ABC-type spermidine/putrescine transport system permease subunit I
METILNDKRAGTRQLLPLFPSVLLIVFVFGSALAYMLSTAFFEYRPPYVVAEFTLENFQHFFSTSLYLGTLYVTLRVAAVSSLLCLVMGYPIAYGLARSKSRFERSVLFTGVLITLFVGIIERIYAWILLLDDNGIINGFLTYLGLGRVHLMYNELGIVIVSTHYLLPFAVFTLMGSIGSVGSSLEEMALGLGASRIRVFVDITLPLTLPGIMSSVLLTFSLGVSAWAIPMMMGGGLVWMLSNMVYDRVVSTGNMPFGSAIALVIMLVSISSTLLLTALFSRKIKVE